MKTEIYQTAKNLVKQDGITFTLDTLSSDLKISKKTIYKHYKNKEQLIKLMIDEGWNDIKVKQKEVLQSDLSVLEKIKGLLLVVPINHDIFTSKNLRELNTYYPDLYKHLTNLFDQDWESLFELLDQAKTQNTISPIDNNLFKQMYMAGVMHTERETSSYKNRLESVINILLYGINIEEGS